MSITYTWNKKKLVADFFGNVQQIKFERKGVDGSYTDLANVIFVIPEDDEELQLRQGLPQDQVRRFLNNSNTANDAMTTVKRFIDRLGTQKSRSCQKKAQSLRYT